ncbi:glycosyltransferase family 4 protein [Miltoncostaea oceani]|uniref:glycosyltransferase family 4 protein n=1 Tax=Miltoncostaea oceani TaxID=2843216 RepID=UPI001C3D308F|nr:glycosyltransferase family 4 protein [Miltoncostaea oceani]
MTVDPPPADGRPPRIAFVLPCVPEAPIGGFRVAYEYANRLSRRGYGVEVVHPRRPLRPRSLRARAVGLAAPLRRARRPDPWSWFAFDPAVAVRVSDGLAPAALGGADVLVATAWWTAPWVARASGPGRAGLYLIQSHEIWDGPAAEVEATWRLPLEKIVISRWLQRVGEGLGVGDRITRIPNGMDLDHFRTVVPIDARDDAHVGFIDRDEPIRGRDDALAVLRAVRRRVPRLRVTAFGQRRRRRDLPSWISYEEDPSQDRIRDLYNSFAVFLHTSHLEGWALPPAEAMACGCAVVAAANEGVVEYADPSNSLLVPVGDRAAMEDGLVTLVEDPPRRRVLAASGGRAVRTLDWDRSVTAMEAVAVRALAASRSAGGPSGHG